MKGANDLLKPADVDAAADLLKSVDFIVLQFEIPLETVYYCVKFAEKNGVRCIVNPAPAQPVDLKALSGLDYFVPNESEAETITGLPVGNVDQAKKCAEKLLSGGVKRIILTLGANGSLLAGQGWDGTYSGVHDEERRQHWRWGCVYRQLRGVSRGGCAGAGGGAARESLCGVVDYGRGNAEVVL